MSRKFVMIALFTAFLLPAFAQNAVTLYEDCNYKGRSATLEAGNYRAYEMRVGNDKLSSLAIPNGMKVTIYEHDNYGGRTTTFTSSVICLDGSWNDMTSSIVVERTHQGGNQNNYIIFYKDCYSRGYSRTLTPGTYTGNDLGELRNSISSFSIFGNLRVKAYTNNDNASGYNTTFEESQSCLTGAVNDKIKSLVIERRQGGWNNNGNNGNNGGWNNNNNNNYATVYTDCNYRGSSLRLVPGSYRGDLLGLLKYDISSIELPSNLRARVYLNNEYLSGNYYLLSESSTCLSYSLNNKIGSLVIESNGNNNNNNNYPPDNGERVIIYSDGDYKGQSVSLQPGTYPSMRQLGFPDNALSSLILPPGFRVILYDRENFQGSSYQVNQSKTGFLISGWNDKTSSIAVYRDY